MSEFTTKYDWANPKEALEIIKSSILKAMKIEQDWYVSARKQHSFFSRAFRVIAIILFGFGILWPIIEIKQTSTTLTTSTTSNWGYISLAVGGLFLLVDKYLGVSSGYVRFYIAELDIKKNTYDFIENWDIETSKIGTSISQENIISLLNLVKTFRQAVFTTIQVETGAWATEFLSQTGELYELFKQKQNENIKLSNISASIENYNGYSDIEIGIDQNPLIKLNGTTSLIFRNVSIQPHLVQIRANKDAKVIAFSKNVDVIGDKTVDVVFSLP